MCNKKTQVEDISRKMKFTKNIGNTIHLVPPLKKQYLWEQTFYYAASTRNKFLNRQSPPYALMMSILIVILDVATNSFAKSPYIIRGILFVRLLLSNFFWVLFYQIIEVYKKNPFRLFVKGSWSIIITFFITIVELSYNLQN